MHSAQAPYGASTASRSTGGATVTRPAPPYGSSKFPHGADGYRSVAWLLDAQCVGNICGCDAHAAALRTVVALNGFFPPCEKIYKSMQEPRSVSSSLYTEHGPAHTSLILPR